MPAHNPSGPRKRGRRARAAASGVVPPNRGDFESPTRTPEYQSMLARLRQAREDLGLSQAEVGRRLGRADQFVSKSETGERRLDPIDLWRFAQIYRQPVSAFLPPEPPPEIDPHSA